MPEIDAQIKPELKSITDNCHFILHESISVSQINHKINTDPLCVTSRAKEKFNNRFPHLNTNYYTRLTKKLLDQFYPKYCPQCKTKLTSEIATRETAVRCPKCYYQGSRTAYTPLHNLRLPLWVFSYVLMESMHVFPQVLTATSIQRRLGCSNNTASLLKRRLQLFLREFIPDIKKLMVEDIQKGFGEGYRLPQDDQTDLTGLIEGKPVVSIDTVALFSARQRSNGYRARYKHTGQTSSIYLSDTVARERGVYQIGCLVHTIGIKRGAVIFDSIPDQKQQTIQPLLNFLPQNSPIFSDEGFPWLQRYNHNHRAINHSKRAKDRKRNVWSRERWSCNGVHSQTAEGFQRVLKHSFLAGYVYIKPEYSQLYLDEWSALKGLTVYGFDRLLATRGAGGLWGQCESYIPNGKDHRWSVRDRIKGLLYVPPTPDSRSHAIHGNTRKRIPKRLKIFLDQNEYFPLKQAAEDYLNFWDDSDKHRKRHESEYNSHAHQLWRFLSHKKYQPLSSVAKACSLPHKKLIRIVRVWAKLNIAEVVEYRKNVNSQLNYHVKLKAPLLPDILYTYTLEELIDLSGEWENIDVILPEETGIKGKYGITKEQRSKLINKEE